MPPRHRYLAYSASSVRGDGRLLGSLAIGRQGGAPSLGIIDD